MTSILHYRDPVAYRSDFITSSTYSSPQMDPSKRSPPYDGNSSGSEAKNSTTGTKKRPSRAGTRSVTTLTAAQLERKRANDREAQRAIRQRTKDHIDSLERQVRDLTVQLESNSSGKMMDVMRRNEELEQENAILRARLSHAVSALGVPEQGTGMSDSISPRSAVHLFHLVLFLLFDGKVWGKGEVWSQRFRCRRTCFRELPFCHPARPCFSPASGGVQHL